MNIGKCALKLGSCRCAGCGRRDRSAALRADCAAALRTEYSFRPSPCVAESRPRSAPFSGSRRAGASRPNVEIVLVYIYVTTCTTILLSFDYQYHIVSRIHIHRQIHSSDSFVRFIRSFIKLSKKERKEERSKQTLCVAKKKVNK